MNFLAMGKVVLRSLFGKPSTYAYPFAPREYPEALRGKIEIDIDECIFCGICSRKCPTDAIEVNRDEKTWTISRMQCVYCSACVDTCPKKCLSNERSHVTPNTEKQVDTFTPAPPEEVAVEAVEAGAAPEQGDTSADA
jgi:formate hydrogenlyase subunit 6/NADH:ubiquinone oxidoreductase subunit I